MTAAAKSPLASAMAEAFKEIEAATKDSENPAFKQGGKAIKYADLSAVIGAVKPALIAHGLFFTQHCHPSDDGVIVETVLGHSEGEEKSLGKLYVPANKRDAQGFGSALTYARRYALMTAFGVPAEDDDGNAAAASTRAANDGNGGNGNGNGHARAMKDQRDAPFPQGPAKNKTDLKTMGRELWRQVLGCGDGDELTALLTSHKDLTKQLAEGLPDWWNGGTKDGEPYDGLATVIANKQTELAAAENDPSWRANPIIGG